MNILSYLLKSIKKYYSLRPKKTTVPVLPKVMERQLNDQLAKFEAVVPDDVPRINALCGEEDRWGDLLNSLRPDDCFWDVGSFTGLLTVFAAQKCSGGTVLSIEPEPNFLARVARNVEINGLTNVKIINSGLSDQPGHLQLNSSGVEGWAPSFYDKGLHDWIEVPMTTVDLICEEFPDYVPNVLKIDVEGFEGKVLRGAQKTLGSEKLREIYLELHPKFLNENNEPIGAILSILEEKGFLLEEFNARLTEVHILAIKKSGKEVNDIEIS
jgi:FkbM family methyltransferase